MVRAHKTGSTVHIPQTGATIHWPHNDEGRVRITASIDIGPQGDPRDLPIELSFKRQQLRKRLRLANLAYHLGTLLEKVTSGHELTETEEVLLVRWGRRLRPRTEQGLPPDRFLAKWRDDLGSTLLHYARRQFNPHNCGVELRSSFSRKKIQTLEGHFSGIHYRLRVDRDNLKSMGMAVEDRETASRVLWQIRWYLISETLNDWAFGKLPRGTSAKTFALYPIIRCAVFCARELLLSDSQEIQRRASEVLADDSLSEQVLYGTEDEKLGASSQRRFVMTLADRALRPALNRHKIAIAGKDISEVLGLEYSKDIKAVFARYPDRLSWWFDLLLGPEGEVARRFHLA